MCILAYGAGICYGSFVIFTKIQLFSDYRTFFQNQRDNWLQPPIVGVRLASPGTTTCDSGEEPLLNYIWPGTFFGCLSYNAVTNDTIYAREQPCSSISDLPAYPYTSLDVSVSQPEQLIYNNFTMDPNSVSDMQTSSSVQGLICITRGSHNYLEDTSASGCTQG